MDEEQKKSFPVIPVKHWWALREQFRRSIPSTVNATYLAPILGMTETSAQTNIIPSLRITGIIDESGKHTERAVKWRDDADYREVCQAIRAAVYPRELLDIASDPSTDREAARRWFATTTGAGKAAVGRMLAVYWLLTEADPSQAPKGRAITTTPDKAKKAPLARTQAPRRREVPARQPTDEEQKPPEWLSVHLTVQIHLSADATPEQIDQIFASIASHLRQYSR